MEFRFRFVEEYVYVRHCVVRFGSWTERIVIDRVIKHLAILLAEFLVAESKDERLTIFITRFNLTAIVSTSKTDDVFIMMEKGRIKKCHESEIISKYYHSTILSDP